MTEKVWDVFISHASEDKDSVARPLANALSNAGVRVWLDEQELNVGDSLTSKIDHGLAYSRFGVVIVSPEFLAKRWTRSELAGLRALEESEGGVILPVWHGVEKIDILKVSPVLADLLAVSTLKGIDAVAAAIIKVVFPAGGMTPSMGLPSLRRRLIDILASQPSKEELIRFLKAHPMQLSGLFGSVSDPVWGFVFCGVMFDAVIVKRYNTRVPHVNCIWFLPICGDMYYFDGCEVVAHPLLQDLLDKSIAFVDRCKNGFPVDELMASGVCRGAYAGPVLQPSFQVTIFCGRRSFVDSDARHAMAWQDLRSRYSACRLRTFDGIIDFY